VNRTEVFEAVRDVTAAVTTAPPATITEASRFREDLDADSLDLVELVLGLEEHFDIEVPDDGLDAVVTVGQAVDLVLTSVT
jgi:acyl carrier protein